MNDHDVSSALADILVSAISDIINEISAGFASVNNSIFNGTKISENFTSENKGGFFEDIRDVSRSVHSNNIPLNSALFAEMPYQRANSGNSPAREKDRIILNADIFLTTNLDGKTIAETVTEYQHEFNRRSDDYGQ